MKYDYITPEEQEDMRLEFIRNLERHHFQLTLLQLKSPNDSSLSERIAALEGRLSYIKSSFVSPPLPDES
jgi:hypothetical protein